MKEKGRALLDLNQKDALRRNLQGKLIPSKRRKALRTMAGSFN